MEKLPNADKAYVPSAKVTKYLLNPAHAEGASKVRFFENAGFSLVQWSVLVDALLAHARENPVTDSRQGEYGMKYVIEGPLWTPSGKRPLVRTVWLVETGEGDAPRFVTAYPIRRR